MKELINRLRHRLSSLGTAYRRFPVTIGLAIGLFAYLILNEYRMDDLLSEVWFGRILSTWIYAILLAFLIGALTERKKYPPGVFGLIYLLGAAIIVLVYRYVLAGVDQLFVRDGVYVYFGLILATLLGIFLEARLRPGQRVPHKAVEVLTSFAWTGLFSFVIGVGSFLVFVMIDYLFQANLQLDRFGRVIFEATMLLFAVPFFLSGLKPSGETIEDEYNPLFRKLLRFVCLPLAFIYTIILYAYSAKILFTWTWPQGLVSHLVLWYSLFVIAVYIFLRAERKPLPIVVDLFPLAVVPLLGMMFGSIGQRIAQYGVTPNRYLVVIAGLWALFALIYLGLRKRYSPWILMASLILFILIGTNSPIGAYDVSVRSQENILMNTLNEQGILENGSIVAQPIPVEAQERISASLQWFVNSQAADQLAFLPDDFGMGEFETVFGFPPAFPDNFNDFAQYVGFFAMPDLVIDTVEGQLLFIQVYGDMPKEVGDVRVSLEGEELIIERLGVREAIRLDFLRESLEKPMPDQTMKRYDFAAFTLYLQSASGVIQEGNLRLQDANLYLLIPAN